MERVVVGVPIDSVGAPGGTELAPQALRSAGVVDAVDASDAGDLDVRIVGTDRDPATGIVGYPTVLGTVRGVRDGLVPHLAAGRFPVVLGGCCTLIPGAVAAAREAAPGRVGLLTIDGHLDLYDAQTSETGEAADLPVALCIGHGDDQLTSIGPGRPLVDPTHVALLAHRDSDEARGLGALMPDQAGIDLSWDEAAMRECGSPENLAAEALDRLTARVDRFWLAIDVDVLSDAAFPATPVKQPGGLSQAELVELAAPIATDPHCIGLSFACYDPDLDTADRAGARDSTDMLERLLSRESATRPSPARLP
jgi:arginase